MNPFRVLAEQSDVLPYEPFDARRLEERQSYKELWSGVRRRSFTCAEQSRCDAFKARQEARDFIFAKTPVISCELENLHHGVIEPAFRSVLASRHEDSSQDMPMT